jgi:hypothetical protein
MEVNIRVEHEQKCRQKLYTQTGTGIGTHRRGLEPVHTDRNSTHKREQYTQTGTGTSTHRPEQYTQTGTGTHRWEPVHIDRNRYTQIGTGTHDGNQYTQTISTN